MADGQSGTQGPTWSDIHDYVDRLQGRWKVHIVVCTRFWETGKPPRRSASVVAEARVSQAVGAEVRAMGVAQFRGNAGAATMPGAIFWALTELEGKLEGIETVAQARLPF